jgi:hypothetical protein
VLQGHTGSLLAVSYFRFSFVHYINVCIPTGSGISSVGTNSTASSFVQPDSPTHVQGSNPSARVVFDFSPTSPFELAVSGMCFSFWGEIDF